MDVRVCWFLGVLLSVSSSVRLSAQESGRATVVPIGYLQPRFESVGDSAVFYLRRGRLGVEGSATRWARFRIQVDARVGGRDTGTTAVVELVDAFIAMTPGRGWTVTLGQYKVPFSREELTSASVVPFGERTLVVDALAPARDVGLMAAWRPSGSASVSVGMFNGEGVNVARNPDQQMLYAARGVASPAHGTELGAAVARNRGVTAWEVDAALGRGPVLLSLEFLQADPAEGWYLQAAYAVRPDVWQILGRVERFDPGAATSDETTGYALGFQRFFGENLKLQLNYTVFDEAGTELGNNRFIGQVQVRW